jgi:hypothetical protein
MHYTTKLLFFVKKTYLFCVCVIQNTCDRNKMRERKKAQKNCLSTLREDKQPINTLSNLLAMSYISCTSHCQTKVENESKMNRVQVLVLGLALGIATAGVWQSSKIKHLVNGAIGVRNPVGSSETFSLECHVHDDSNEDEGGEETSSRNGLNWYCNDADLPLRFSVVDVRIFEASDERPALFQQQVSNCRVVLTFQPQGEDNPGSDDHTPPLNEDAGEEDEEPECASSKES